VRKLKRGISWRHAAKCILFVRKLKSHKFENWQKKTLRVKNFEKMLVLSEKAQNFGLETSKF
jgi:hypothetical protein